ncbi:MAG: T9SS type A sorting domain-containing protein [Candidatus Methylacidiphilales bacterium]
MKSIFTITILFISTVIWGQPSPTVTSSVLPIKGDTIFMALDTVLVSSGASGPNRTWDFSTFLNQDILVSRIYIEPSSTPYANKFLNAKLCRTDGIGSVFSYWDNSNANKSVYYGFVEPNIYDQNYNTLPINFYKFPINYGDSYADSTSALTNPGAIVGPGKYYFDADAWGTLKLPKATFSNVLRTKSVIYIGDSSPIINSYSLTTEYAWYHPNQKEPLLAISSVIINHDLYKKFVLFNNSSTTNLNELTLNNEVDIYPNPTNGMFQISISSYFKKAIVSVFDYTGKEIQTIDLYNKNTSMNINKKGIYFVKIMVDGKTINKKLIVD